MSVREAGVRPCEGTADRVYKQAAMQLLLRAIDRTLCAVLTSLMNGKARELTIN